MEQLKTLLVANRGEIAARIIKTAKQASPFFEPLFRDTALTFDLIGSLGSSIFAPSQSIRRQMQLLVMLLRPTNRFYCLAVMLRATLTGEQSRSGNMIPLSHSLFYVPQVSFFCLFFSSIFQWAVALVPFLLYKRRSLSLFVSHILPSFAGNSSCSIL